MSEDDPDPPDRRALAEEISALAAQLNWEDITVGHQLIALELVRKLMDQCIAYEEVLAHELTVGGEHGPGSTGE